MVSHIVYISEKNKKFFLGHFILSNLQRNLNVLKGWLSEVETEETHRKITVRNCDEEQESEDRVENEAHERFEEEAEKEALYHLFVYTAYETSGYDFKQCVFL